MSEQGIFAVDGQIVHQPWTLPPFDRGFLYGESVFESMSGFGDCIFDLPRHLERLEFSASRLGLELPWPQDRLSVMIRSLVAAAGLERSLIRIFLTTGTGDGKTNWYTFITAPDAAWQENVTRLARDGASLMPVELGFTIRDTQPKWSNYGRAALPLQRAKEQGFSDILWINSEREVVEASTANVFFMGRAGDQLELVTIPVRSGALEGTMRAWVMERLREAEIKCEVAVVYSEEIPRFDEAFLTSSLKGILPVARIGNHRLVTCRPKSTFHELQRLFRAAIARETGKPTDWISGKKEK